MSSDACVGVDGGGTRATALVTDGGGRELARLVGGPGLISVADPVAAAAALASLVTDALDAAAATPPAAALCCALAGAGDPDGRAAVIAALEACNLAARVQVIADAEAALVDAFGAGPGLLVIAGTGSIAIGRTADGSLVRVGGWGALLGDEGSAYAIGLAALRAVLCAHDGRSPPTALVAVAARHTSGIRTERVGTWAARASKAAIAALAPDVIDLAREDAAAASIVRAAVAALADHARTLARRTLLTEPTPALALTGGLLAPGRPLRDLLRVELADAFAIREADVDAARGAATLARRAAEQPPP